jgi:hypothetical protein
LPPDNQRHPRPSPPLRPGLTQARPPGTQFSCQGDQYAARHDGFTFFRSVTGNQAYCDAHILSFRPLPGRLARASTTPAFSWISPNLCDDGHDAPCVTGAPGGLAQADAYLVMEDQFLSVAARQAPASDYGDVEPAYRHP